MNAKFDCNLWQDQNIKFDVNQKELNLGKGENIMKTFHSIEDTKGNTGDLGKLTLTNLRIVWQSKYKIRINLTIGLNCINSISKKCFHSDVLGNYNSVQLMCKLINTRYEFIFTQFDKNEPVNLIGEKEDLIFWLTNLFNAYIETRLYRDLKFRCALFNSNKQLNILPNEKIYNKIHGIWNLSSHQGNLGIMIFTNIRIVWVANQNELFNLSLPYIQINSVKIRESKFGRALVIESTELNKGYIFGFRIDPQEKLQKVFNELNNLFNVHNRTPDYGVEKALAKKNINVTSSQNSINNTSQTQSDEKDVLDTIKKNEDEFVEEVKNINPDIIASYLAEDTRITNNLNRIVYSKELGVSIEAIKPGYTLQELWNI